jgi:spore coat polysaccharide biosynthesis protein SpsF
MKSVVLVVIQCRYNSTRLPGKALYPIAGIPMLIFLLKRLRFGLPEHEYHLVLATTQNHQDDGIVVWGLEEGVQILRGEEHDVLKRYIVCLEQYPAETVVRVTADNPLTCPDMLKWLVRQKQTNNVDYAQALNLPYGGGVDVFSANVVKSLDQEVTALDEREHINLHIYRHQKKYTTFFPKIEGELARPDLRMTVDTREDWERIRAIFTPEDREPWRISLAEAIVRMDSSAGSR